MPYTLAEINDVIRFTSYLQAIAFVPTPRGRGINRRLICKCACGNTKEIGLTCLVRGYTKSCGCLVYASALSIDEINERIKGSDLTALSFANYKITSSNNSLRSCNCLCKCGKKTIVLVTNLVRGHTLSCGCKRKGILKPFKYTVNNPAIYSCWGSMISRCYDKLNSNYKNYGGKGVKVCEEWKNDYQPFLTWALANGWKKGLQLDKDIKGDGLLYSPETCLFVTPKVNCNNKKCCIMSTINGVKMSLKIRCELIGLDEYGYRTIAQRVTKLKWDIERAINTPINKRKKATSTHL